MDTLKDACNAAFFTHIIHMDKGISLTFPSTFAGERQQLFMEAIDFVIDTFAAGSTVYQVQVSPWPSDEEAEEVSKLIPAHFVTAVRNLREMK